MQHAICWGCREFFGGAAIMRQIQHATFGGPEVLEVVEVAMPVPGPDQVRVRANLIGMGRWDMLQRSGGYAFPVPLPGTLGLDMAGTVDAVGPNVTDLKVGDRVYAAKLERGEYCSYADQMIAKREETIKLDDNVDFESAVCLGTYRAA